MKCTIYTPARDIYHAFQSFPPLPLYKNPFFPPTFERPVELIYYRGPKGRALCRGVGGALAPRNFFLIQGLKWCFFRVIFDIFEEILLNVIHRILIHPFYPFSPFYIFPTPYFFSFLPHFLFPSPFFPFSLFCPSFFFPFNFTVEGPKGPIHVRGPQG